MSSSGNLIAIEGVGFCLLIAPKEIGENQGPWLISDEPVLIGSMSIDDGFENTQVMAAAGCQLARWVQKLDFDGHRDWYIPSQIELEAIYQSLERNKGQSMSNEFNSTWYWSSTEASPAEAYGRNFHVEGAYVAEKGVNGRVRAIRRVATG